MAKVQRISDLSSLGGLSIGSYPLKAYWEGFLVSDLGQIYQVIPWDELVSVGGLREKPLGKKAFFSPAGKLGLKLLRRFLFLKNYSGLSDEKLLSTLNGSLHYQFFCSVLVDPTDCLKHRQLVSHIRGELAHLLPLEAIQKVLARYWEGHMSDTTTVLVDATCYESEVRYPTDVKLLWESVSWLYDYLRLLRRSLGQQMIRTKYRKWAARYGSYSRKRKPRVKKRNQLKRGLLRLLNKLIKALEEIENTHFEILEIKDLHRIHTIKKVYEQQAELFYKGEKPKQRIVSLAKDYLRPIVRGKENKPVEFGAKVNKLQIDGINFIEHLNFEAFHEGNRLQASFFTARTLVGKIKRVGADRIYATNANRRYCTKRGIFPDFIPKGRKGKFEEQKKILRKAISKERATRLEGNFGNEKNAYHLRKIRVRTKKNEILWIFFGIHTANAREIGKRIAARSTENKAA